MIGRTGKRSVILFFCISGLLCSAEASGTTQVVWSQIPPLPDAEGFASAFAGVSDGILLVAGGANFPGKRPWDGGTKVWYDYVFALESPQRAWKEVGRLPKPLAYGVSVTTARGLVCLGGGNAQAHYRDATLLQWKQHHLEFQNLAPLPFPSAFGCGIATGEKIFLVGGIDNPNATAASGRLVMLDLDLPIPVWRELPSLPGPGRMLAQIAEVEGNLFLFGGVALSPGLDGKPVRSYLRDAYRFTIAAGWKRLADLPKAIAAAPTPLPVSPEGKIYLISGDDGSRVQLTGPDHPGFKQEIAVYSPQTDTWQSGGLAPISRATAPTALWRGGWVIVSGERRPGYRTPEMWTLNFRP